MGVIPVVSMAITIRVVFPWVGNGDHLKVIQHLNFE
jgi:hypothetical protein